MSVVKTQTKAASSKVAASPKRKGTRPKSGSQNKCLLVGSDEAFLVGAGDVAAAAGWDCDPCPRVEESLRRAFLQRYGLAIVDVGAAEHRHTLADLFRVITGSGGGLVLACDRQGDTPSELWSRENGAWLYLPGVSSWEDLTHACHEAIRINQRLREKTPWGAMV
ncbi:MAG: hypothetical protein KDA37_12315 [Planctomycetales bacterium]|nr:hypothetical protein [Planctomycetales bacterium]